MTSSLPTAVLATNRRVKADDFPSGAPIGTPASVTVLIVAPTLDVGAADAGAVQVARILAKAGHRAVVVSSAGRLVADVSRRW